MQMQDFAQLGTELENTLRLRTKIIAYRRLETAAELDAIKNLSRINHFFSFCHTR